MKTPIKKLQSKAEKLWKEYCYIRDGKQCWVRLRFPNIKTKHTNIYQVDHCFSRSNKELFLDVANGTVVCSSCNLNKKYNDAIRLAINDIVMQREGLNVWNRMREVASGRGGFPRWRNILWLEEQINILESMVLDETKKQQYFNESLRAYDREFEDGK